MVAVIVPALAPLGGSAPIVADDVLYRSADLRILRSVGRGGTPVLVLTNLDDRGARLAGETEACPAAAAPFEPVSSSGPVESLPQHPGLRVIVNAGADTACEPCAGATEVPADGAGGTTVVVNVGGTSLAPGEGAPLPILYGSIPVFGLPGPFVYPSRQPFLGYGAGNAFPSFFGGLALHAGNRFGLKTGRSCGAGYDCLFRP